VGVGSQEEEVGVVALVVVVAAVAGETGTGSNTDFLKVFYSTCFLALLITPDIGHLSCS